MVDRRAGCFSDSPIRGTQRQFRQAEEQDANQKAKVRKMSASEADTKRTKCGPEKRREEERREEDDHLCSGLRDSCAAFGFLPAEVFPEGRSGLPGAVECRRSDILLKVAALREADAIPEVWIDHGIQAIVHHGEGNGGSKPIANRTAYFTSVLAGEAAKCGSALGPLLASVDVPPHLLDRRAKGGETA